MGKLCVMSKWWLVFVLVLDDGGSGGGGAAAAAAYQIRREGGGRSCVTETIFPRIYARTYYAHPRARVMSFSTLSIFELGCIYRQHRLGGIDVATNNTRASASCVT
jgi:hypothetical protein